MSLDNVKREELFAFKSDQQIETFLNETWKIRCPNCTLWYIWSDWKADRIDLTDEAKWGKNATHIRIRCPNCNTLIDHRNTTLVVKDG